MGKSKRVNQPASSWKSIKYPSTIDKKEMVGLPPFPFFVYPLIGITRFFVALLPKSMHPYRGKAEVHCSLYSTFQIYDFNESPAKNITNLRAG